MKHIIFIQILDTKRNVREFNSTQCFSLECFNVSGMFQSMFQAKPA